MKEKLNFKDSAGRSVVGILSNPTDDLEKPIIVLCHGFSSNKDRFSYIELEKALNHLGISTFRFDFFGHGESDGEFEDITVSKAVDDALSAIDFMKVSGYKKIGLMGSSFGGIVAIITASKVNDLFVLALKSPVSDYVGVSAGKDYDFELWRNKGYSYYELGKGEKKRLNYSFYDDIQNVGKAQLVANKIRAPTIIVHGDTDKSVPVEQSINISKIIPDCKLKIIKGAGHRFDEGDSFKQMMKFLVDFIFEKTNF